MIKTLLLLSLTLGITAGTTASAALPSGGLNPDQIYTADAKKMDTYIREGLIVGGDRAMDDIKILDIRHAVNKEFERIVLDIDANKSAGAVAIERPPYYQFDIAPELKRIVVTVWGKPKLGFNPSKIKAGFRKSKIVKNVELLPNLERDRWTFVLNLKSNRPVEVFELGHPVRVILDIKTNDRLAK